MQLTVPIAPTQLLVKLVTTQLWTHHIRILNLEASRATSNAASTSQLTSSPSHTAAKNLICQTTISNGNATNT